MTYFKKLEIKFFGIWRREAWRAPLPNVVRPCCREAAALRGTRHAKRGGAAAEMGHNVKWVTTRDKGAPESLSDITRPSIQRDLKSREGARGVQRRAAASRQQGLTTLARQVNKLWSRGPLALFFRARHQRRACGAARLLSTFPSDGRELET